MKILVTGGSSGLGKAVVTEMAKDKENIILFTYYQHEDISYRLSKDYSNVKGIQVDFTNSSSVDAFVEFLATEQIDVLVNNAYIGNPIGTYFHKTDSKDYLAAFQNNVLPLIKVTQTCIIGMRKRKYGRFNITSNCVLPDFMNTGFGHVEDFQLEQMKSTHPLKELLDPSEVAEVVYHLIKSSQQINGIDIPINAGQHMM